MAELALIDRPLHEPFAQLDTRTISAAEFLADVDACAEQLPPASHYLPLVDDRYHFLVLFGAALARGAATLLPTRREAGALGELRQSYPGLVTVATDTSAAADSHDTVAAAIDRVVRIEPGASGSAAPNPRVPETQTAAVAFTSGSTGTSQQHVKSWGLLAHGAAAHGTILPAEFQQPLTIVGTVPAWHMYGFEWTALLPLRCPATVSCGADFYPADLLRSLALAGDRCLLVATPLHLRALLSSVAATAALPARLLVMSATAPLSDPLAREVAEHLGAQLIEIYGCSEIGSLAVRQPLLDPAYRFFPWLELEAAADSLSVRSPYLEQAVVLADRFRAVDGRGYELLGRSSDLVKVGGKRESLGHLNQVLTSLPGVEDGVFYDPEQLDLPGADRLGALVVAPGLDAGAVRSGLAAVLDPVFLPRPLRLVPALPRDPTSKLKQSRLRELVLATRASTGSEASHG